MHKSSQPYPPHHSLETTTLLKILCIGDEEIKQGKTSSQVEVEKRIAARFLSAQKLKAK
jgi:hypothetical protein